MAKSSNRRAAKAPKDESLRFETALDELQQIVTEMEDGSLGLDESMQKFERGIVLLRICHAILEQAEQKIEILTGVDPDGSPITEPFDASATADQVNSAAAKQQPRNRSSEAPPKGEQDSERDPGGTLFS